MADFASVPPPGELDETYASSVILAYSVGQLYENVTSSTQPEVHNILHCRQKKTVPRSQVTCTQTLVKFGHVVF